MYRLVDHVSGGCHAGATWCRWADAEPGPTTTQRHPLVYSRCGSTLQDADTSVDGSFGRGVEIDVGRHPGYSTVARAVYRSLPSLVAARPRYPEVTAPVHLIYGDKDWSRPSDQQANRRLLPNAEFTLVPRAGHFIALERPDVPADLLNTVA